MNYTYSDCLTPLVCFEATTSPIFFNVSHNHKDSGECIILLKGEHSTVLTREDNGVNFFIFSQDPND